MSAAALLETVRKQTGLSQDELARRAATARTAVSAYEHGRKQPATDTLERLLHGAGFQLRAQRRIDFVSVATARGRSVTVPTYLPQLPVADAFAEVELPLTLNWSQPGRTYQMAQRSDRARVYEAVLTNGEADDVLHYIDGALLVDLFDELILPRDVRAAWSPVITAMLASAE